MPGVAVKTERSKQRILCRRFFQGNCRNFDCPDAHGEVELHLLKQPSLALYKREICRAFQLTGFCYMGAACFDIHGDELSHARCPLYRATGRCYFPETCPFEHHPGVKSAVGVFPHRARVWRGL